LTKTEELQLSTASQLGADPAKPLLHMSMKRIVKPESQSSLLTLIKQLNFHKPITFKQCQLS